MVNKIQDSIKINYTLFKQSKIKRNEMKYNSIKINKYIHTKAHNSNKKAHAHTHKINNTYEKEQLPPFPIIKLHVYKIKIIIATCSIHDLKNRQTIELLY